DGERYPYERRDEPQVDEIVDRSRRAAESRDLDGKRFQLRAEERTDNQKRGDQGPLDRSELQLFQGGAKKSQADGGQHEMERAHEYENASSIGQGRIGG